MLVLCVIGMSALLLHERTKRLTAALAESQKWDRILLATDIGRWKWFTDRDEMIWDAGVCRLIGHNEGELMPSFAEWASHMDAQDVGWLDTLVQKTIKDRSSFHAVFRMKDGTFIRAYGKVIGEPGNTIFAGVVMPSEASEYTGKPLAFRIQALTLLP